MAEASDLSLRGATLTPTSMPLPEARVLDKKETSKNDQPEVGTLLTWIDLVLKAELLTLGVVVEMITKLVEATKVEAVALMKLEAVVSSSTVVEETGLSLKAGAVVVTSQKSLEVEVVTRVVVEVTTLETVDVVSVIM